MEVLIEYYAFNFNLDSLVSLLLSQQSVTLMSSPSYPPPPTSTKQKQDPIRNLPRRAMVSQIGHY